MTETKRAEARTSATRRGFMMGGGALLTALTLAGCSSGSFDFGGPTLPGPGTTDGAVALPAATGKTFGQGPVRVALLLPTSGDEALASVGTSMANAAELAISHIEADASLPANISIVLKDTGPTPAGATQAASQAVQEGASLILGPLRAEQVTSAGAVARSAGLTVIGFSNNSGAASPGVYLLNVLPETEVHRSMAFAKAQGKRAFAGVFPTTDFGRIQEGAFRQAAADLGLNARALYNFSSEEEARTIVGQLVPLLQGGQIDTVFLPDRATAPSFGVLLEEAGVPAGTVQIVGSADWNGDAAITSTPYLAGAIFPSVDDAGYQALAADYRARYGADPHPLATIAYTAVILANNSALATGTPKYDRGQLTIRNGFNGRDGVFRFLADGRSEYALVIKQVTVGGATIVDGAKL